MRKSGTGLRSQLLRCAAPIIVAAMASSAAGAALAQDAPQATADTATVGEIVVTAQFRAQNLQQTPIAITAVNAAMMEARGMTDVSAVAAPVSYTHLTLPTKA